MMNELYSFNGNAVSSDSQFIRNHVAGTPEDMWYKAMAVYVTKLPKELDSQKKEWLSEPK